MKNVARPESKSPHEESIEILATRKLKFAWITFTELIAIEDGRKTRAKKRKIIQKKRASFFFTKDISMHSSAAPAKKINNFISINKLKCASTGSVRTIWKTKQEF